MKKLSETLTEMGIDFSFPIKIMDAKGNETYYEKSNGFWWKCEYDRKGNLTHYKTSEGKKKGTPKSSKVEPINPDAATFEVTITNKEHDIILSLSVPASPSPKMT
jgi:hypothetical protein